MDSSTAAALNGINRRFYDRHHQAFSATRTRPWPGWKRAVAPFLAQIEEDSGAAVPSILDVGCGNGRFAVFLDSVSSGSYRYFGVDSSQEMIRYASRRLQAVDAIEARFQLADLTEGDTGLELAGRHFDLVVLFGVLHHIPGLERRRRLLDRLVRDVAPNGYLILSFWQFGRQPRFQRRILDWTDHNRSSSCTVDVGQLEPGDHLLAWGNQEGLGSDADLAARRYCHFADSEEAAQLTHALGLSVVDRFASDGTSGDLNLYFVLQASG